MKLVSIPLPGIDSSLNHPDVTKNFALQSIELFPKTMLNGERHNFIARVNELMMCCCCSRIVRDQ